MKRLTDFFRGWWRAWIAAIGGANQQLMREAYTDAFEPTSAEDGDLAE